MSAMPDFHSGWLMRLEDLNEQRSKLVYDIIEREGWPADRRSSLERAYETPEVEAIDARIAALKEEFGANPGGKPREPWPGTDQ